MEAGFGPWYWEGGFLTKLYSFINHEVISSSLAHKNRRYQRMHENMYHRVANIALQIACGWISSHTAPRLFGVVKAVQRFWFDRNIDANLSWAWMRTDFQSYSWKTNSSLRYRSSTTMEAEPCCLLGCKWELKALDD